MRLYIFLWCKWYTSGQSCFNWIDSWGFYTLLISTSSHSRPLHILSTVHSLLLCFRPGLTQCDVMRRICYQVAIPYGLDLNYRIAESVALCSELGFCSFIFLQWNSSHYPASISTLLQHPVGIRRLFMFLYWTDLISIICPNQSSGQVPIFFVLLVQCQHKKGFYMLHRSIWLNSSAKP